MLSWLRRKPQPKLQTFNERALAFWKWYEDVAPRFFATIEAGKCPQLTDETSAKVDELLPGFAWVYGPGANGKGHSFTLSGEGDIHRQLLALHWLHLAPKLEGWTFYAARQPGPIKGHVIEMMNLRFDPKEIWITPQVDTEAEKVHVNVWHPAWMNLEVKQRATVVFLFLDEVFGEYGTEWWIGKVEYGSEKLAGAFPLEELGDFIAEVQGKHGWKKIAPGDEFTLFQTKDHGPRAFPRSDVLTQITAVPRLFRDFMECEGEYEDPIGNVGADYLYVSVPTSYFPRGKEADSRGQIEERLDAALRSKSLGRCIGGAFGKQRSYVDLLVFDGENSVKEVRETLSPLALPRGSMIEYFARNKRGQRIVL